MVYLRVYGWQQNVLPVVIPGAGMDTIRYRERMKFEGENSEIRI